MKSLLRLLPVVILLIPAPASAQVVVDHTSLALFQQIPPGFITAARDLRMMFIGRSVGVNVNQGLDCLSYGYAASPNYCRTTPAGVTAETWSESYTRSNWTYYGWPGLGLPNPATCTESNGIWSGYQPCFLSFTQPRIASWDVVSFQFDYLAAVWNEPIASYFNSRPGNDDAYDFNAFLQSIAPKHGIYWTTSLMKSDQVPGMQGTLGKLHAFNEAMRGWVGQAPGRVLIDLADIVSHRPNGTQCVSAEGYPRICDEYGGEQYGGHLTTGWGRVRVAKAVWIAMARMAGWVPGGPDSQPPTVTPLSCTAQSGTLTCSAHFSDNVGVSSIQSTVTARDAAGNPTTVTTTVTPQ